MTQFILKSSPTNSPDGAARKFDPIPNNEIVRAEVVEVKLDEKPQQFVSGPDDTHRVSFHFKVTEGSYKNRHLWGNTATWFTDSPKCKLRLWVQEILGVTELPEGFNLDLDSLKGRQVRLLVGNREKKDGSIGDFVSQVIRYSAS